MILMQGARGKEVLELQRQLIASGAQIKADGMFGKETKRAVRDFQRKAGIKADGVVGDDTRNAFNMPPIPRARAGALSQSIPVAQDAQEIAPVASQEMPAVEDPNAAYWDEILAMGDNPMLKDHIAQQQAMQNEQVDKRAMIEMQGAQPATIQQRMNAKTPDASGMQQRFDKYLENKRMGR